MSFKRHEVHDLQIWNPQLRKNIHIDRCHTELFLFAVFSAFVKQSRNKAVISPLYIEVSIQGDGKIFVRHLNKETFIGDEISEENYNLGDIFDMNLDGDYDRFSECWQVILLIVFRQADMVVATFEAIAKQDVG